MKIRMKKNIARLHRKHNLTHRTVFYMSKGRNIHFHGRIIKESLKILVVASVISTIGGIGLESLEKKIVLIMPLLILLPALNDMIGDFGTIVSSKFTTDLYLGKIKKDWWKAKSMKRLFRSVIVISFLTALYISVLSSAVSLYNGFQLSIGMFFRIVFISAAAALSLVSIIFAVSVIGGLYAYSRKEDPNNFLIPLTTSIADLGSMAVFTLLVATLL